ncbi:MAG: DNA adenine methylase [Spirochaetes bacterium]|nr:DNA adenine methylase [Spirochaetota bacterium]
MHLELLAIDTNETPVENSDFLTEQLITYIGNKRTLLDFIGNGLEIIRKRLGKHKLDTFDVFSGSGVVSRYLKQYSETLYTNDLEKYATIINQCYLTNIADFEYTKFNEIFNEIKYQLEHEPFHSGFIAEMYAPFDDKEIKEGERVFFTTRNAKYLDTARQLIESVPDYYKKFLLAPLLSEASIHANTSGVFKGFYKNTDTGIGQFGGKNQDALFRITGNIIIPQPIFSNYNCDCHVYNGDSNIICEILPEVDVAYLDPPYNQHPYGSNYFMLNALLDYKKPESISNVSGIPDDWNRSQYNRKKSAYLALSELVHKLKAKYLLISFNSEGHISLDQMVELLKKYGKLTVLETKYNAFRGSRNLFNRDIHVKEYLYLLEKY